MKHGHNVTRDKVLDTLRALPNITTNDLFELIPECPRYSVQSTVSKLYKRGVIVDGPKKVETRAGGVKFSARTYAVSPKAAELLSGFKQYKSTAVLTDAGLNVRIEELKREVQELRAWKSDAMERFPDLAVPPLVLKARKFAADEARSSGDSQLANSIMCGHKDNTLLVRVALKILEEANG